MKMKKTSLAVRWCASVLSFVLMLAVAGCAHPQAADDYFAYAHEGMEMTVRATITRTASDGYGGDASRAGESYTGRAWELVAAVTTAAPNEGGGRVVSVTFSSPPVLAGVTVSRACTENGATVTVSRTLTDGKTVRVDHCEGQFDGLLRLAEGWLPQGDVVDVSPVTDGARAVTVSSPDGGKAVYTFSESEKIPLRVALSDAWGEVELVRDLS